MLTAMTLVSLVFWSEGGLPVHMPPSRTVHITTACEKSGAEDLLPAVVGPMVGSRPAWIVDGGDNLWERAGHAVKTLWVFSRTSQTVQIKGTRLDGPGTATFRRGQDDPVSDALVINDPSATSAIPRGASREVMRAYSFIPSHVFYPSPGCWEFAVRIGRRVLEGGSTCSASGYSSTVCRSQSSGCSHPTQTMCRTALATTPAPTYRWRVLAL